MATIQGIYLAFFGRPADPGGLAFWEAQTDGGADLSVMLDALADTEEYQQRFAGQTQEQIIQSVYQSLFNRPADPDGLAFFLDALAEGTLTLGSIAVGILDGAQGADAIVAANKEAAADAFTASLDTPEKIAAYVGADAIERAQTLLSTVTSDPATIPSAEQIEQVITTITTPDAPPSGPSGPGFPPGYFDRPDRPDISFREWNDAEIYGSAPGGGTARLFDSATHDLITSLSIDGSGHWRFLVEDDETYSVYVVIRSPAGVDSNPSNTIVVGSTSDDVLVGANEPNPDFALSEVHGRAGNDTLTSGAAGNVLYGGPGNNEMFGSPTAYDGFVGGPGADIMDGGYQEGNSDDVDYRAEGGPHGVVIRLGDGDDHGWAKDSFVELEGNPEDLEFDETIHDRLININNIYGTDHDDYIVGNSANNIIRSFGGNDYIDGGDGFDEIHYRNDSQLTHVVVNLSEERAEKYFASGYPELPEDGFFTDTLVNIENVRGSRGNDTLTGDDGDNRFRGLEGNDTINGGGGTNNTVDYSVDERYGGRRGIDADLSRETIIDGFGDTDTVTNIQNVRGTRFNDVIVGDDQDNVLEGGAGDDVIRGGGGNDTINGGAGNDFINGGTGNNTLDYWRDVAVDGATKGIGAELSQGRIIDPFGDIDTVENIQNIIGTDLSDLIVGDANENMLHGLGGNDILDGFGGSDNLYGGSGDDIFVFIHVGYSRFDGFNGHSRIFDFRADGDEDQIRLQEFSAQAATGELIEAEGTLSNDTFVEDVVSLFDSREDQGFAALLRAGDGDLDGRTFLIIDDGSGAFEIENDLVIELTGTSVTSGLARDWFYAVG